MPPTVITREKLNTYKTSDQGQTPSDLFIYEVDDFMGIVARTDSETMEMIGTSSKQHERVDIVCGDTDLPDRQVTISGSHNDSTGTINLTTNHGNRVQQWDQLYNLRTGETFLVQNEPGASQLTGVTRGRGSEAAAAMNNGDVCWIVGPAVPQGASAPLSPMSAGGTYLNSMQILEYSFKLSHRARVTKTYEFMMDDRFKEELSRLMTQSTIDLGRIALLGVREPGDGSPNNPSSTGGLYENISTNVFDAGGTDPLEFTQIMDLLQDMYLDVGKGKFGLTAMGDPTMARIWDSIFSELRTEYPTSGSRGGNAVWDSYKTRFGVVTFEVNHEALPGTIALWDPKKDVELLHYKGGKWSTGVYATDGWFEHGFLRGDYGFKWRNERRRALIKNINTSPALYANIDQPS